MAFHKLPRELKKTLAVTLASSMVVTGMQTNTLAENTSNSNDANTAIETESEVNVQSEEQEINKDNSAISDEATVETSIEEDSEVEATEATISDAEKTISDVESAGDDEITADEPTDEESLDVNMSDDENQKETLENDDPTDEETIEPDMVEGTDNARYAYVSTTITFGNGEVQSGSFYGGFELDEQHKTARLVNLAITNSTKLENKDDWEDTIADITIDTVTIAGTEYLITEVYNTSGVYGGKLNLQPDEAPPVKLNITFGPGVNYIGENAFRNSCVSRIRFAADSSLEIIGNNAFQKSDLTDKVVLPKTCKQIGNYAFSETKVTGFRVEANSNLENSTDGLLKDKLGVGIFKDCSELSEASLPDTVKVIPKETFAKCSKLLDFTGANKMEKIGESAFAGTLINTIFLPETLSVIEKSAFENCIALESVNIPKLVDVIDEKVFCFCTNLASVTFTKEENVKSIEKEAFADDGALEEFEIPSKLESLKYQALRATCIKKVHVPETLVLAEQPFFNCKYIKGSQITWDEGIERVIDTLFQGLSNDDVNNKEINIELPSHISAIGKSAFAASRITAIQGDEVLELEESAFAGSTVKSALFIKNQTIGDQAFDGCHSLEDILFISNERIGKAAFRNTYNLLGLQIFPLTNYIDSDAFFYSGVNYCIFDIEELSHIGDRAFRNCKNLIGINTELKNVSLDCPKLTEIGEEAFMNCGALIGVEIGDSVEKIGANAFNGDTALVAVAFNGDKHNGVTTLEVGAFAHCTNLERVSFSGSVGTIGTSAFEDCTKLLDVKFTEGLKEIENRAFYGCVRLEGRTPSGERKRSTDNLLLPDDNSTLTIPASVTKIGDSAFENNYGPDDKIDEVVYRIGLKNLIIADKTEGTIEIGKSAFSGCKNLTNVSLGEGVTSLGNAAFTATNIEEITIPSTFEAGNADVSPFDSGENSRLKVVNFKPGNQYIAQNFLKNVTTLEEVVVPATVKEIGKSAFEGCVKLNTVTMNNTSSLEKIGNNAFKDCALLEIKDESGKLAVGLNAKVTTIETGAFLGCKALSIKNIPAVEKLDSQAFKDCTSIKELTIDASALTSLPTLTFEGCTGLEKLTITGNDDQIAVIESSAFSTCENLKEVNISNIKRINLNAFKGCNKLEKVSLSYIESVESGAFTEIPTLATVDLKNVGNIGSFAFKDCPALKTLTMTAVDTIQSEAFSGDLAIENLSIKDMKTIGENAFNGCTSLETVVIDGLTTLTSRAFNGCTALKNVDLANVTSIQGAAFDGCSKVDDLSIKNVQTVGDKAFYEVGKDVTAAATLSIDNVELVGRSAFVGSGFTTLSVDKLKGITLDTDENKLVISPFANGKLTKASIGEGMTKTLPSMFQNVASLKEVALPSVMEEISVSTFKGCAMLEKITNLGATHDNELVTVKLIRGEAFNGCKSLKEISMSGIESIESVAYPNNAFGGCDALSKVDIVGVINEADGLPKTVIGNSAFMGNAKLQNVSLKDVLTVSAFAFKNCASADAESSLKLENVINLSQSCFAGSGYKEVVLPKSIRIVELGTDENQVHSGPFAGGSLKKVTFEDGFNELIGNVMRNTTSLEEVVIPESMTTIAANQFMNCTSLKRVIVEDTQGFNNISTLLTISEGAFNGCSALETMTLTGVRSIAGGTELTSAFGNCTGLKTVSITGESTFDGSVSSLIGDNAFANAINVENLSLENINVGPKAFIGCASNVEEVAPSLKMKKVISIGALAFQNAGFEDVVIPASLVEVGLGRLDDLGVDAGPFVGGKLKTIHFDPFTNKVVNNLCAYTTSLETIDFASAQKSLKTIGTNAFKGCSGLTEVVIPDKVTVIEPSAFEDCTSLVEAKVGAETVFSRAFNNCTSLTDVDLLEGVKTLQGLAFANTNIDTVTIPSSLVNVTVLDVDGKICGPFAGTLLKTLHGEVDTTDANADASGVTITANTAKIAPYLFAGCESLEEVKIPSNVTSIGTRAFLQAEGLKSLTMEVATTADGLFEGVQTIEDNAFEKCASLETVVLPKTLVSMGNSVFTMDEALTAVDMGQATMLEGWGARTFEGDPSLATVILPKSEKIKLLPAYTFARCDSLDGKSLIIPQNITRIGEFAFTESGIKEIYIPNQIIEVGQSAFLSCCDLTNVHLSTNMTSIAPYTFMLCESLEKIEIPAKVSAIFTQAFYGSGLKDVYVFSDINTIGVNATDSTDNVNIQLSVFEKSMTKESGNVYLHVFNKGFTIHGLEGTKIKTFFDQYVEEDGYSQYNAEGIVGTIAIFSESSDNYLEPCMKWDSLDKNTYKAASVKLNNTALDLFSGNVSNLVATVTKGSEDKEENTTDVLTWSSSDEAIASVDQNGNVTARGEGTAVITAKAGDAFAACEVNVKMPVNRFEVRDSKGAAISSITMEGGDIQTISVAAYKNDNSLSSDYKISVDNANVISYDKETGELKALKKGSANITFIATDGSNKRGTFAVNVVSSQTIVNDLASFQSGTERYLPNSSDSWTYTEEGASQLEITFDDKTEVEENKDFIYIYDGKGNLLLPDGSDGTKKGYTGKELQNKTIVVPGDTIRVQIVADESGELYGFKVKDLAAVNSITYYLFGGTNADNPETFKAAIKDPIILKAPTKENSTFAGWYTDAEYTSHVVTEIKPGQGSVTLYAKWNDDVTITYVLEDGEVNATTNPTSVVYDAASDTPLANPTKAGYTFGGWYLDKDYTNQVTAIKAGTKENIILYAKWIKSEVTNPNNPINPSAPTPAVPGSMLSAEKAGANYKVTSSDASNPTVEYIAPKSADETKIVIPASVNVDGITYQVTTIAKNAFKNNKVITSVKMPATVKTIGNSAFSGCIKLKTVTIGKNVTTIGNSAFQGCKVLAKVTIPAKVTKIGKKAFYKCSALKTVTIKTKNLKTVGGSAFKKIKKGATIKNPSAKKKAYQKLLKSKADKTTKIK